MSLAGGTERCAATTLRLLGGRFSLTLVFFTLARPCLTGDWADASVPSMGSADASVEDLFFFAGFSLAEVFRSKLSAPACTDSLSTISTSES